VSNQQPSSASAVPSSSPARLLDLTALIVSAHAGHNPVAAEQLPELIRAVHRALDDLGRDGAASAGEPARPEPAVPIRRSVRHDRIACLECGAWMKMLKRHLATDHGMTPESYRARWDLPRDYPMVAPDYAATRSSLAKQIGLGRKRGRAEAGGTDGTEADLTTTAPKPPAAASAPEPAPAVGRRGRPRRPGRTEAPAAAPQAQQQRRGQGRRGDATAQEEADRG